MKPIFGIDLADKSDISTTAEQFIIYKPSEQTAEAFEDTGENANQLIEKAKLPLWLRIIEYICGIVALLVGSAIAKLEISIAQGYKNAPYVFWIGGISLVVFIIIFTVGKIKSKSVLTDDAVSKMTRDLDARERTLFFEMNVPEYAEDADILCFTYKIKDGKPVPKEKGLSFSPFINVSSKIYIQDGMLCLADHEAAYAFPLFNVIGISTVNKKILIPDWNKATPHNKDVYKQYKITQNQYGYWVKNYHILEFAHNGETYGLYFPCYELPIFERLTGHKATAPEK